MTLQTRTFARWTDPADLPAAVEAVGEDVNTFLLGIEGTDVVDIRYETGICAQDISDRQQKMFHIVTIIYLV